MNKNNKHQKKQPVSAKAPATSPKAIPTTHQRDIKPLFKGLHKPGVIIAAIILRFKAGFRYMITGPFSQVKKISITSLGEKNGPAYRLIFVLMVIASTIIMPMLSFDYGITWDEKIQRDYGKEIIEYYESGRKDTSLFDQTTHLYNTMLYYGCSFDVLTCVLHDKILPDSDEFELRHFINALFGVFMMLYTALVARYLGSWRTACIAFVFCMISPSLFGHAMNNPKDVPFAASYIFAIYFMFRFLKQLPYPHIKDLLFIAIGVGWTISTRAGGIILLAFLGMFMGIVWLAQVKREGLGKAIVLIKRYAVYFILISVIGYLLGLIIWPYGQRDIIHNPINALKSLTNVNYLHTYENFDGLRIYMSRVPWYYIIKWITIGSPLFILSGCAISLIFVKPISKRYNYNFILVLIFIFIFPIFYIVYKNSMVYNGWRHFLFVYLSLVIIAAIGWEFLCFYFKVKWVRFVSVGLCTLLSLNLVWWMVKNHPYEYIYFNELVGGTKGAKGNYEMDYYSNSIKEAVYWLVKNEKLQHKKVKVVSNNELLTLTHHTEKLADSIQVLWTRDYERYKQDWDYAIFTTRTFSPSQLKNGFFPPKGTIKTIDVDGVPVCAIVKRPDKFLSDGYALSSKNKYVEALPYFEKAIEADPVNEESYRMAGLCLLNLGRQEEAFKLINKCIELNPEGFMSYYLKAFYYLDKKDPDTAEKFFKISIQNRINNGDAHAELGNIYLDKGLTSMALDSYKKSIEFGNTQPRTYTNMGVAYINVENYETAINLFNLAINKDPGYLPAYDGMATCFERVGDMATVQQIRARIAELRGY